MGQDNQLYGFGSNINGQLGLNFNVSHNLPISRLFIPSKHKIISISCGSFHTLVLDQVGNLYSAGKGQDGAIGQRTTQDSYEFNFVLSNVQKMSAGHDHSLAIVNKGLQKNKYSFNDNNVKSKRVYGWGSTQCGQLGLHSKKKFLSPQQLNVYPCEQVIAGPKYSIFVTIKGLYGCGMNNNYQLGLGHQKDLHYPKKINLDLPQDSHRNLKPFSSKLLDSYVKNNEIQVDSYVQYITKVWCNNYCFVQTNKEQIYLWGTGAFGVYKFPTKINFFRGCSSLSLGQTFGICQKNQKIYVWGSNRYGQLGLDKQKQSKDYACESTELSQLQLFAFDCGINFVVGLSYKDCEYIQKQQPNKQNSKQKSFRKTKSQKDYVIEQSRSNDRIKEHCEKSYDQNENFTQTANINQEFYQNSNIQQRSKNSFYSSLNGDHFFSQNYNNRDYSNGGKNYHQPHKSKHLNSVNTFNNISLNKSISDDKTLKKYHAMKQNFQIKSMNRKKQQIASKKSYCQRQSPQNHESNLYLSRKTNFNNKNNYSPNNVTYQDTLKLDRVMWDINQIKNLLFQQHKSSQGKVNQVFEEEQNDLQKFGQKLNQLKQVLRQMGANQTNPKGKNKLSSAPID